MNISNLILNWILNWIIFAPHSMFDWIIETCRTGLLQPAILQWQRHLSDLILWTTVWGPTKSIDRWRHLCFYIVAPSINWFRRDVAPQTVVQSMRSNRWRCDCKMAGWRGNLTSYEKRIWSSQMAQHLYTYNPWVRKYLFFASNLYPSPVLQGYLSVLEDIYFGEGC